MTVTRGVAARNVAGIVLAAGAGTRMGQPKALLRIGGVPLVATAVHALQSAGCRSIAVVVGAAADEARALVPPPATVVVNPLWRTGIRTSLYEGLRALQHGSAGAVLITLVDQPGIGAEVAARLIAAWSTAPSGIVAVVATYDGMPRNPVIIARRVWAEVTIASGPDEGARAWLRMNPGRVLEVECGDIGAADDIDTPEDLLRWERS